MTDPILEQEPKLAEIVRRLVEEYRPERIFLFGSVARGNTGRTATTTCSSSCRTMRGPSSEMAAWPIARCGASEPPWTRWSARADGSTPGRTWKRHYLAPSCAKGGCSIPHDRVWNGPPRESIPQAGDNRSQSPVSLREHRRRTEDRMASSRNCA